jgi:hypothetical protein
MGKTDVRKFDGVRYYSYRGETHTKTGAEKIAADARKAGNKARVIPYGAGYRCYVSG